MCKGNFWIGLILVGLLLVGIGAQVKAAQPGDSITPELTTGVLGAVLGGVVGGTAGTVTLVAIIAIDHSLNGTVQGNNSSANNEAGAFPVGLAIFAGGGLLVGMPLGAVLGVNSAGDAHGVQGDLPLAIVGAVVGEIAGLGLSINVLKRGPTFAVLLAVPITTALGATVGYNWGAKMKAGKTKAVTLSWQLPLFEVSF
jgi:hypothetical protein